jgi:5,10-methenyltetrahydromethanopterin hydrogenase
MVEPLIQSILEAHGAPKPLTVRPDLADDIRHIAAHEPDPRKEQVLYEAAEALEQLSPTEEME